MRPFIGVNGARSREDDEGYSRQTSYSQQYQSAVPQAKLMTAKYAGRCAATGQAIKPGDLIKYNPVTRTSILHQSV